MRHAGNAGARRIWPRLNRKGISHSYKQIHWTFIVLPAITLVFGFILGMLAISKYNAAGIYPGLTDKIVETRLLYSDSCFAYSDPAGRIYPGTIDFIKFNEATLNGCIMQTGQEERSIIAVLEIEGKEEPQLFSDNFKTKAQTTKVVTNIYPVQVIKGGETKYGYIKFQHWY